MNSRPSTEGPSCRGHVNDSHRRAISRFGDPRAAAKYAGRLDGTRKDRREKRCIGRLLDTVPAGARVLDLPCGTGRLTDFMVSRGWHVHATDSSEHMVAEARRRWQERRVADAGDLPDVGFSVEDVMETTFPDGHFDAVVCNRLFHHFVESETRVAAFQELRRITRGILVVSFFNSFSLDALYQRFQDVVKRRQRNDRLPIPLHRLTAEAAEADLILDRGLATRWGVSQQYYAAFRPR